MIEVHSVALIGNFVKWKTANIVLKLGCLLNETECPLLGKSGH